jgi:hypothetical protein
MRLLTLAALALLTAAAPLAQSKTDPDAVPSDPRVEKALNAMELVYETEPNGDYRLLYDTGDGRSHLVWVRPQTQSIGELEVREVFATAHEYEGEVPEDVAYDLLRLNSGYVTGSWCIEGSRVIFIARVDADASDAELDAAIGAVLFTTDDMEKELTGGTDDW